MAEDIPLTEAAADRLRPALRLERFFPDRLTVKSVAALFPHSGLRRYRAQELVIEQGEASRDLYVVEQGLVAITKTMGTAGAQLATLGRGRIFGEMALLRDGVRVANAVAVGDCEVFRVAFLDVQALMAGNPELAEHLKSLASQRAG